MDELSMIRQLLAESPPLPHVVAQGRDRLFESPARDTRPTRSIKRTIFRSAVGLAVTGAAVVVAIVAGTVATGGRAGAPRVSGPVGSRLSARNVLLAAAARAEYAPTSGTYWHVRTMSRYTWPKELGNGDERYTVEHLSIHEEWAKHDGQAWEGDREWVRPKTSEDEAAWRRDGSPSKWCMGVTDTDPPQPNCQYTSPGTASVTTDYHPFEVAEGQELTFEQLQKLPNDPDGLRAWVVDGVKHDLDPSASGDIVDFNAAEILTNLLVDVPVPPDVRAAAYRALADMPNVKSTGPTQDELGRDGIGILIDAGDSTTFVVPGDNGFASGELALELIIDPDTSQLLATQASAGSSSDSGPSTVILEAGWTDEGPHEPALP